MLSNIINTYTGQMISITTQPVSSPINDPSCGHTITCPINTNVDANLNPEVLISKKTISKINCDSNADGKRRMIF